jgi:integrase
MEARPWKDGRTVTYRFRPFNGKPMNLGTDKAAAIRRVAAMTGTSEDTGTFRALWQDYRDSPEWDALSDRTKADYESYSVELLRVFGDMHAAELSAPMVARYLRVERKAAPVRANREISLLGNLVSLAIERGEAEHNPCRGGQVKRNKERPRTTLPETSDIQSLVKHAATKGGQWSIITMAAEFAALAGSRQAEFLRLHWPQFGTDEVRLRRAKQRKGVEKVEKVAVSPALLALRSRLQAIAKNSTLGVVFPNRQGNAYTASGFASMWGKLMREAVALGIITKRFTFHDLRAYYATQHNEATGSLPDLHANPTTTATVYNRAKASKRTAL